MLQISKDASPHELLCWVPRKEDEEEEEEGGKIRAHPLSLRFAALHMSDSPIVDVWGCNTPQEKTRKRYTIGYFICGVSSGRLYISQGKQGPLSLRAKQLQWMAQRDTLRMERKGKGSSCFSDSGKL